MKPFKKRVTTLLLILVFIAGLSLLFYPFVSNWWNERVYTRAIASYVEAMEETNSEEFAFLHAQASAYNETLVGNPARYRMDDAAKAQYLSLMNGNGSGIMAYIEIPLIHAVLPIYHGTSDAVLQTGIGHLEGSSLPVGGKSTHCVLSGHRGLPAAKLFTNLNKLKVGDVFYLRALDELLTYQVDQVLIVKPQEVEALEIAYGKDYCTLVTCTPYGVNSHRLLVRGTRIENAQSDQAFYVTPEAFEMNSLMLAPFVAAPILLFVLLFLLFKPRKNEIRRKKERDLDDESPE